LVRHHKGQQVIWMKETAPVIAVGLGILLLAISALWGVLFPASQNWTNEKAQRMSELTGKVHGLLFKAEAERQNPAQASGAPGEAQQAYKAAKEELDKLKSEFESQRDRPQKIAQFMRWTGIGLVLVGGLGVLAGRNA